MNYHVEVFRNEKWSKVPFAESAARSYCEGYIDAMDALYPSKPHRLMKGDVVIRTTKGRAAVGVGADAVVAEAKDAVVGAAILVDETSCDRADEFAEAVEKMHAAIKDYHALMSLQSQGEAPSVQGQGDGR